MIHAHAVLCCDAPGCSASVAGLKPLRYGQLNPLDVAGLNATAAAGGWAARLIEDEVRHYCPEHVPPRETPAPGEMVAALAAQLERDSK